MNQSLEYFKAYCQLNQLPIDKSWVAAAEQVIKKEKKLHSLSRWSFFLDVFDEYCRWDVALEVMMTMGDSLSEQQIKQSAMAQSACAQLWTQLQLDEKAYTNAVVVVDEIAVLGQDMGQLEDALSQRGSMLFVLKTGEWAGE